MKPEDKARRIGRRTAARFLLLASIAVGLLGLLACIGVRFAPQVIRIATNKGELIVETADRDIEVTIKHPDRSPQIILIDRQSKKHIELTAGDYALQIQEKPDGLRLLTKEFQLKRGDVEVVKVRLELAGPAPAQPCKEREDSLKKSLQQDIPVRQRFFFSLELGVLYLDQGRNKDADAFFHELAATFTPKTKGLYHLAHVGRAITLALEGRAKESNELFSKVFADKEPALGGYSVDVLFTYPRLHSWIHRALDKNRGDGALPPALEEIWKSTKLRPATSK